MSVLSLMLGMLCYTPVYAANEEHDPAEIAIGERLFLETRFAQRYFVNNSKAEPVLENTVTTTGTLAGAFAGKTMNCRACHMVDEHAENPLAGMRTYADYARRSPIPDRNDGNNLTGRNSMSMVNISLAPFGRGPAGALFHFDGQFNSMTDLVRATLTGRNYGWLPGEAQEAISHVANVIRQDDGEGELAQEFGGSYKKVLTASAADLPAELKLSAEFTVDVATASDQQIFDAVATLIAAYVTDLSFSKNDQDVYDGSAYDLFLKKNNLPAKPLQNETVAAYSKRLGKAVAQLKQPVFVAANEKQFTTHRQPFEFGETELQGMKLFFARGNNTQRGGNCASCHSAPDFSDFQFHNTGLIQTEYDAAHGAGQFMKLGVPELAVRNRHYNQYLPATEQHPQASGRFRQAANQAKPGVTDLGLWNVFANPDMPAPQEKISRILCEQVKARHQVAVCKDEDLLKQSLAAFKTPVLRDLGHSAPYFHTGGADSLEQVVAQYAIVSALAKAGQLRNGAAALQQINITADDIAPLVAFLKSLNEDYE